MKRTKNSKKDFMQNTIFIMFIAFLLIVSFTSCQKDEIIINTDKEISESARLKSGSVSITNIEVLILKIDNYISTGNLEQGIGNALISKLENAIKSLEKGKEKPATNQVQAVINQLDNLIGTGNIDSEIAKELIFDTQLIAGENPTFIDKRDGKEYKTILIGEQVWMAENFAHDAGEGCFAYMNDEKNVPIYGRLYTWSAANNACPEGWHIPNNADWAELIDFLITNGYGYEESGDDVAKSLAATTNWFETSISGTPGNEILSNNRCGFSGLPAGLKIEDSFVSIEKKVAWWCDNEENTLGLRGAYGINFDNKFLIRYDVSGDVAISMRYIRD